MRANLIGSFEFHVAQPAILLTACPDQLVINNLIKLCSTYVKPSTTVKTTIDASSLWAK